MPTTISGRIADDTSEDDDKPRATVPPLDDEEMDDRETEAALTDADADEA
jgi:hypothetical protein